MQFVRFWWIKKTIATTKNGCLFIQGKNIVTEMKVYKQSRKVAIIHIKLCKNETKRAQMGLMRGLTYTDRVITRKIHEWIEKKKKLCLSVNFGGFSKIILSFHWRKNFPDQKTMKNSITKSFDPMESGGNIFCPQFTELSPFPCFPRVIHT